MKIIFDILISIDCNATYISAVIRTGDPLARDHHHYWEVEMTSPIYGSAVMVGVGTEEADVHGYTDRFAPVIGVDKMSWGYSHLGLLHHDSGERLSQVWSLTQVCSVGFL